MLLSALLAVGALACEIGATARSASAADAGGKAVTRVDPAYVCMVNDRSYPKPQIAVPVDGRTYYGCCEMCKTSLAASSRHRTGTDPVTGNTVDKASAVIGVSADGRVHYFANEETFLSFSARANQ